MKHFSAAGMFWLSDKVDRRVPGELEFDSDGIRLRLHDSLEAFELRQGEAVGVSPRWKTFPIVYGQLHDDRRTTLLDVSGVSFPGPFDAQHEDWSVDYALINEWSTYTSFDQARFSFDALLPWADPPGLAIDGDKPNSFVIDTATAVVAETVLSDGTRLRLLTGASGTRNHARVDLEQWCAFETTGGSLPLREILHQWVRPLQDLLIVSMGRPVRLTSLHVRQPGAGPRDSRLSVHFAAIQPAAASAPTAAQLGNYDAPTLIMADDSGLDLPELLRRWRDVRQAHHSAVTLLCGPFYAPFIYGEHRYASTFQAVEALATRQFATRDKTKDEHRARVAAVTAVLQQSALSPDVVGWAAAVVNGSNNKPLHALVQELTSATDVLGASIMGGVPDFPKQVAKARTGVSHGGGQPTEALRRHWLGELLSWVLRTYLLDLAGIPMADSAQRAAGKPSVRQAIERLAPP